MTTSWRRREEAGRGRPETGIKNLAAQWSPQKKNHDEQGSGIIIDRRGFILTCNHVVASADALFVVLNNGRKVEPLKVWADPATDLALIQIDGAKLNEVQMGNSDHLQIGDWVVSLANPYDLNRTVSAGIVSSPNRWLPGTPHPLIQNDAATNPGSSGGALINLQGEVVGIITGGMSTSEEFQGIGFAIPINTAKRIAEELQTNGAIQRGYLGCETQMLSPEIAKLLELSVAGGLYVKDVKETSPASHAGIKQGDVITHFDGQPIDVNFRLQKLYLETVPDEKHVFRLNRYGQVVEIDVEFGRSSARAELAQSPDIPSTGPSGYFDKSLGLSLENLHFRVAHELGLPNDTRGVLITHVAIRGVGYMEGLAAGMVILRIDDHPIRNVHSYRQSRMANNPNRPISVLIQSNQGKHLVVCRAAN